MIDEKKLIERFKQLKRCDSLANMFIKDVIKVIESQPGINDWIPCSERLPEDGVDVLVWFEYFRYGEYNRLFQTTGISYTYNGNWSGFVNGESGWDKLRIIAWQPLPNPYCGN